MQDDFSIKWGIFFGPPCTSTIHIDVVFCMFSLLLYEDNVETVESRLEDRMSVCSRIPLSTRSFASSRSRAERQGWEEKLGRRTEEMEPSTRIVSPGRMSLKMRETGIKYNIREFVLYVW